MNARPNSSKATPVRQQVKRWLTQRLARSGADGGRIPSVRKLGERLGVAPLTVHRAIREMVNEGLLAAHPRQGVFAVLPREGETPALSTRLAGRRVVVVHTEAIQHFIVAEAVKAFTRPVRLAQACVEERELPIIGGSEDQRVDVPCGEGDATVLVCPSSRWQVLLNPGQVVTVITDTLDVPLAEPWNHDLVLVDQEQGGMIAGEALLRSGMQDACFVGVVGQSDGYNATCRLRLHGFERAWGRALSLQHLLVAATCDPLGGAQAARAWLAISPRPGAVFCATDQLAVGFLSGAAAHGLEAGRDYQLVGFGGLAAERTLQRGPLASVGVPLRQLGHRAAELLADRLANAQQPGRRLLLGCSLLPGWTLCS